jgi:hypothetical protein
MQARLQLAALDHNKNANLQQAVRKDGELSFKLRYSKVAKKYIAAPIKHAKSTDYRQEIIIGIAHMCAEGNNLYIRY